MKSVQRVWRLSGEAQNIFWGEAREQREAADISLQQDNIAFWTLHQDFEAAAETLKSKEQDAIEELKVVHALFSFTFLLFGGLALILNGGKKLKGHRHEVLINVKFLKTLYFNKLNLSLTSSTLWHHLHLTPPPTA